MSKARRSRVPAIDALRGLAILAMVAYHFCFDLRYYGLIRADFENDPFWLGARALILTSFMLLVGMSLVLARRSGATRDAFWRRLALIAACALAVSAGSYLMFPGRFIYFGVLHCIAVAILLAAPFVTRPRTALVGGLAIIVAGVSFAHPAFDARALSWLGFTTMKPPTEDFVPLAPWSGLVFVGIALAHALTRVDFRPIAPLARLPRATQWLGRHSLAIYMIHQPILLGVLWVIVRH